jgi:NAD(P)H-quinone oxidoreductase subunit 5
MSEDDRAAAALVVLEATGCSRPSTLEQTMTEQDQLTTVGQLPNRTNPESLLPAVLTRLVWLLWVATLGVLGVRLWTDGTWGISGVVAVDGLTVVMWTVVTFFSGIVHSYSRRYMAGQQQIERFFAGVFGFTLVVMVLVAADHIALFAVAWLAMGLTMAELIGHVQEWPQAQAATGLARRYFLASGGLLTVALATLWVSTGATSISGIAAAADTVPFTPWLVAAGALLGAAMIQSALVPFQTWLLASMTAPTPASALMHAGFVNAGGVLLVRFAPVISVDARFMLLVVVVGAISALSGKFLKSVQPDIKSQLGCSTVGQMGFMIMQAGLGFFGAAITHLILHGFYKAYQFLSAGDGVTQTSPTKTKHKPRSLSAIGFLVTVLTAVVGGILFGVLTGKGLSVDSGLLLALLVVLTTLHATRNALAQTSVSAATRYGLIPLVFLPAIAVYAGAYTAIAGIMKGIPIVAAPAELTAVHGVVAVAFAIAYVVIETGLYQRSQRLYVALLNATQPPSETILTSTEEYNEY